MGCNTAWHRDTVAAPFPIDAKSVTINIYLDDIGADGPNGDALIYVKGSHSNLETPPAVTSNLFEPSLKVGDVLAHDPHIYHTPSGRGCWNRRSLHFRYVQSATTFEFAPNRFPHGPIPWTLAHAPGVAPHGLIPGKSALSGPWYPKVFPQPIETEHAPLDGSAWRIMGLLKVGKQAQDIAADLGIGNAENCTIDHLASANGNYSYFGFDGPVTNCEDWDMSSGVPVHKGGQMIHQMIRNTQSAVGSDNEESGTQ